MLYSLNQRYFFGKDFFHLTLPLSSFIKEVDRLQYLNLLAQWHTALWASPSVPNAHSQTVYTHSLAQNPDVHMFIIRRATQTYAFVTM